MWIRAQTNIVDCGPRGVEWHVLSGTCTFGMKSSAGDVSAIWSKSPGINPIAPPLQWRLMYELAQAINALHTHNPPLMHRDIKGANVFLDKDLHVKLADFDLVKEDARADQLCGTPGYMVLRDDGETWAWDCASATLRDCAVRPCSCCPDAFWGLDLAWVATLRNRGRTAFNRNWHIQPPRPTTKFEAPVQGFALCVAYLTVRVWGGEL